MSETREQILAGIRERIDAAVLKIAQEVGWETDGKKYRAATAILTAFVDSESERVLLEAAKRLCHFCLSGDVPVLIPQSGAWMHSDLFQENSVNGSWPFGCRAAAIHDLRSKGEGQNGSGNSLKGRAE